MPLRTKLLHWIWEALKSLINNNGIELSGYIAYTTLLALFPFVIFLLTLGGFLGGTEGVSQFITYVFRFAPEEVRQILAPVLRDVMGAEKGGLITAGIIGTLWVASSGIESLRTGLNRAYDVEETRSLFWRRLQSVFFVVMAAFVILFASVVVVIGPYLFHWVQEALGLPRIFIFLWNLLRYPIAFVVISAALSALYLWLPNTRQHWRDLWPGAVLGSGLWLLLASLFSFYLSQGTDYSATYGSLAGAIITMLFFHLSILMFILGAELNSVLIAERRTGAQHREKLKPKEERAAMSP